MKKLIIALTLASFAFVQSIQADIAASASNVVQQAEQSAVMANKALALANSLIGTNSPTAVVNTNAASTNASPTKETISAAVVDILNGVKGAGSEIYSASRTAIVQAVDFTKEQAPLVVEEFLHWKLAESIIYAFAWAIPAFILLALARFFNKKSKDEKVPESDKRETDRGDYTGLKWVFRIIALIVLTINLTTQGMVIAKICIAPRVYLIEYVVDTVHNGQVPSR